MFMAEVAVGQIGQFADTNVVNMTMNFNDYFLTNEGYRIHNIVSYNQLLFPSFVFCYNSSKYPKHSYLDLLN